MKLFGKCFHRWIKINIVDDSTFMGKPVQNIIATYKTCKDCGKVVRVVFGFEYEVEKPYQDIVKHVANNEGIADDRGDVIIKKSWDE